MAIVLAAGQGTRMKSRRPKVLHEVAGKPLLTYPIDVARRAGADRVVVVVGYARDEVEAALRDRYGGEVETAVQEEQKGTGHAARCGLDRVGSYDGPVVILYGDCPLIPGAALEALLAAPVAPLSMLTARLADPTGYGRLLRAEGEAGTPGPIVEVREQKDCTPEERAIDEVNPGIYAIDGKFLDAGLKNLSSDNAQGELYLTDLVAAAANEGAVSDVAWDRDELRGINDRWELAYAERRMQERLLEEHARAGVTIVDPSRTWVGADVTIGSDAILEPGVVLRGATTIGAGARIDVGSVLTDVTVAEGAWLKPYTVAQESRIGERAQTGPFAHLRPKSDLGPETRVGNFVETKKTRLGKGSKANHLAYLGDGEIGEGVNVGAGVIFCNYDGFQKHTTTLEDGSFVGSDCQIVAPIIVGKGAYVATGTTVTRNVPPDALAVGRARQSNKDGYAARLRARLQAKKDHARKSGATEK
ncbi:MAG: bifunctional UDP-N-acetylglucosamine diphosphorylase/glucosamine-1-phosphate N-acetyltransferase GlmU [Myxococcota bacterium]